MSERGVFVIAGTDTGVGKTIFAAGVPEIVGVSPAACTTASVTGSCFPSATSAAG